MAFGHMSGWNILEDALTRSTAYSVEVLWGRAFFQTEPAVLLRLRKLQQKSSQPKFAVRLASAIATFHPKVWIIQQQQASAAIVGSGNLSGGGLLSNVECGIYTDNIDHIAMLQDWFNMQWSAAPSLEKTYEAYISKYQKIEASRKSVRAMIEAATDEQASEEAKWHRREALSMAQQYWASGDGGQEVRDRVGALARMRTALNYPSFKFSAENWDAFLHIPELGRIRFGHKKKTIADLQRLQELLRKIASAPGSFPVERAVQELQEIGGIGRNLATKLLAMNAPSEFVVVNEPVERALRAFGYPSWRSSTSRPRVKRIDASPTAPPGPAPIPSTMRSSRIRHADLGRFTIDRLMGILNRLGSRIEVRLRVRRQPPGLRLRRGA